jgi:carboxypeptidase D
MPARKPPECPCTFSRSNSPSFPFNDTFSAHIHDISTTCGYDSFLANELQFPPPKQSQPHPGLGLDGTVLQRCLLFEKVYQAALEINPCFDIYNIAQMCPSPWDILEQPGLHTEAPETFRHAYFNRSDVRKYIHAPINGTWTVCSQQPVFLNGHDLSPPSALTGGPLQHVIEATNNVIVAHGTLDMVLILNGSLLTLQDLIWNKAKGFSSPPMNPFYVPRPEVYSPGSPVGGGVLGRWVSERGLTFCSVELSGHEVPTFQPSAAFRHMELLLGRIGNLSETTPFSTQQMYHQDHQPLETDCNRRTKPQNL